MFTNTNVHEFFEPTTKPKGTRLCLETKFAAILNLQPMLWNWTKIFFPLWPLKTDLLWNSSQTFNIKTASNLERQMRLASNYSKKLLSMIFKSKFDLNSFEYHSIFKSKLKFKLKSNNRLYSSRISKFTLDCSQNQ